MTGEKGSLARAAYAAERLPVFFSPDTGRRYPAALRAQSESLPAPGAILDRMQLLYEHLAPVYDVLYGLGLQQGRRRAMARLAPRAGEWILEVGVGTGLSALDYPPSSRVLAIDLSSSMLARACSRLERRRIQHVALCRMDAAGLGIRDAQFDAVYAPYLMNVVPDPIRVAREMIRVCRPGGRLVLLNHFVAGDRSRRLIDRLAGAVATSASGARWDLRLDSFLDESGLTAVSVETVNLDVSSVVVCRKS